MTFPLKQEKQLKQLFPFMITFKTDNKWKNMVCKPVKCVDRITTSFSWQNEDSDNSIDDFIFEYSDE